MGDDLSYDRDKLYDEVWAEPVTVVAKRYGVSDVAIHKACKRLNVPVPPRGYWAKLRAGQKVTREPLPPENGPKQTYQFERPKSPAFQPFNEGQTMPLTYLPDDLRGLSHFTATASPQF